jgi:hypothetical protein
MSKKASLTITGRLIEPHIFHDLQQTKHPILSSKRRASTNYLPTQRNTGTDNPTANTLMTNKPKQMLGCSLENLNQLQAKGKKNFEVSIKLLD